MRWTDVGEVRPKMRWADGEPVTVTLVDKSGDVVAGSPGMIGDVITFSGMPALTVSGAFVGDRHGNRRWLNFDSGPKVLKAGDTLDVELKP